MKANHKVRNMQSFYKSLGELPYKNNVDFKSFNKEELGIDWIK